MNELVLYKTMYAILCVEGSKALELLEEQKPEEAAAVLKAALLRAEDRYIRAYRV